MTATRRQAFRALFGAVLSPLAPAALPSAAPSRGRLMTTADAAREAGIADWEVTLASREADMRRLVSIGISFPHVPKFLNRDAVKEAVGALGGDLADTADIGLPEH
jgi:hypothetical protein